MDEYTLKRISRLLDELPPTNRELALAVARLVTWARRKLAERPAGRPRLVDRSQVAELRRKGLNSVQIANELGCASSTIRMIPP